MQGDGIILLPSELFAPAVELEVEDAVRHHPGVLLFAQHHREGAVVAHPGIIAFYLVEQHAAHLFGRELFLELVSGGRHIGCSHKQLLVARDDICQFEISICNFRQIRLPVGAGMWPGEHDGALWLPFGRECEIAG